MSPTYHLANLRALLTEGFTAEALRRFCFDTPAFRPVYDELAGSTGKAEIVQRLLEQADRTMQFEALLAWARAANPARFQAHGPYRAGEEPVLPPEPAGAEPLPPPQDYTYHAYISYVDREPDATWVWQELLPRLEAARLRVAVSGASDRPGTPRLANIEQAIAQARRIVVVLSPAYLADHLAEFENLLAQTSGLWQGQHRLLPLKIAPFDEARLRGGLRMLSLLDLTHPRQAAGWAERVAAELGEE